MLFACGVIAGALGAHRLMYHSPPQPSWKESGKEITLERFKKELDLTAAQSEQLETILDDFFTYYHTLQAQLDDVRASGKQRILRVLNDQQKRKFEKLMSELQERRLR
jgi:Spy/CpxP family protein refolding chaperone